MGKIKGGIGNMTQIEFSERYIAGNEGDIEDAEVQKLWVEYGFTNILIESIDIITDKDVVNKIFTSDIWKSKKYILKEGKINNIRKIDKEIVEHLYEVEVKFLDKNGHDKYELKGLCDKDKMEQYKGQELYVIMSEEEDKIQRFSCFLIKE